MTDILSRIDDTLTFHSAGLGVNLEVPVERDEFVDLGLTGHYESVSAGAGYDFRVANFTFHVVDPPPVAGERVPYLNLSPEEREAVHAWVREHGLEPSTVPVEGLLGFDEASGEWRIRVFRMRDGKPYPGADGEIAAIVVRRVQRRPLPWPVYPEPEGEGSGRG